MGTDFGFETVQDLVRQVRDSLGLTQDQLARKLGTRQVTVSRWETGSAEPTTKYRALLYKLADQALNKSKSVHAEASKDHVSGLALDWARKHVRRFGDGKFCPFPFEYKVISSSWSLVRSWMEKIDFKNYAPRAFRRFMYPKDGLNYRPIVQLDPLDTILYTAVVFELSAKIEGSRVKGDLDTVLAYRVQPSKDGGLFQAPTESLQSLAMRRIDETRCSYIVEVDVSDFFSQISHSRLLSALEMAGISEDRSTNLVSFLSKISGGHARGLPQGLSASRLLAEAVMNPVDRFLLRSGYVFTRYVDDFVFFCRTREEAKRAVLTLSDYLYTAERLAVHPGKTVMLKTAVYRARLEREEEFNGILSVVGDYMPEDEETPSGETLRTEEILVLLKLFDRAVPQKGHIRLKEVKAILRVARKFNVEKLLPRILSNLEKLVPALREVVLYLNVVIADSNLHSVAEACFGLLKNSAVSSVPIVREWFCWLCVEHFAEDFEEETKLICEGLGTRVQALLARKMQYADWVQYHKQSWLSYEAWDRRGLIYSGAILPGSERRAWMRDVSRGGDTLEQVLAKKIEE